jgi:hypothetical protein
MEDEQPLSRRLPNTEQLASQLWIVLATAGVGGALGGGFVLWALFTQLGGMRVGGLVLFGFICAGPAVGRAWLRPATIVEIRLASGPWWEKGAALAFLFLKGWVVGFTAGFLLIAAIALLLICFCGLG